MGDNLNQLTSLPYSNFQDEPVEEQTSHEYSQEPDQILSLQVDNVTSTAKKTKGFTLPFASLSMEKKVAIIVALSLVLLSLVTIVFASIEKYRKPLEDHLDQCRSLEISQRIDAGLGIEKTKQHCTDIGGCWDSSSGPGPKCYYPSSNLRGYKVVNSTVRLWGMEIDLERIDVLNKIFDTEEDKLRCVISYETDSRLRVKIYNPSEQRYEVPMSSHHEIPGHRMQYILSITEDLFGFSVSRTHEARSTIFNTTFEGMIFSDQLLQLNMMLSSRNVYGLSGDHQDGLLRRMEYNYQSLWSTAVGKRHGAHPFLLHVENDGHASGFFLQNSNAMDILLNPYPAITFRTTGGILDFYIFLGPTPTDVMAQLSGQIGKPHLPPLWALGYHTGTEAFNKTGDLGVDVILAADRPLDGLWLGRSVLAANEEFSLDTARFAGLDDKVTALNDRNIHVLVQTRPAILASSSRYTTGQFIQDKYNKTLVVKVLGGPAALPDYFHPNTLTWLTTALSDYHTELGFQGLFLDENEPSTVSDGSVEGCSRSDHLDNSIYSLYSVPDLKKGTVCPSARHHGGLRHYDVHNIYGWKSAAVTQAAMLGVVPTRSLLLSRSTYLGSGVHAGHFIKENSATWEDMRHSVVAMLNYNMFGIPLTGANVCGYHRGLKKEDQDTEEEMCVRWHQLAVFYPFSKRFSSKDWASQQVLSEAAQGLITRAIKQRYSLLPTLYTLYYSAHTRGLPVVSPLFFDYLEDSEALKIETQFMFGQGIMVAPVLKPHADKISVYFPKGLWYDYLDPLNVITEQGYKDQTVKYEEQTYFVKGGHMVLTHQNMALNTFDISRNGDYILDVYLNEKGDSFGELYTDDGMSADTISHDQFLYVRFNATSTNIRSEVTLRYPGHDNTNKIQGVNIRGLQATPHHVTVNGEVAENFLYEDGILKITLLDLPITIAFMITYT